MRDDEEYRLPFKVIIQAEQLRSEGKWTIREIAGKLDISFEDLQADFDLRRREIEDMDE